MCFHENKRDWMDFLLFNVFLVKQIWTQNHQNQRHYPFKFVLNVFVDRKFGGHKHFSSLIRNLIKPQKSLKIPKKVTRSHKSEDRQYNGNQMP